VFINKASRLRTNQNSVYKQGIPLANQSKQCLETRHPACEPIKTVFINKASRTRTNQNSVYKQGIPHANQSKQTTRNVDIFPSFSQRNYKMATRALTCGGNGRSGTAGYLFSVHMFTETNNKHGVRSHIISHSWVLQKLAVAQLIKIFLTFIRNPNIHSLCERVRRRNTFTFIISTRHVHKVSFPLVPQLANLILREVTAHT
jgi:hypothetical protein